MVRVGGFLTASVTRFGLAELMAADCLDARAQRKRQLPKLVFSSNGQGIALAGRDSRFAAAMAQADIIHADGMSTVFASRLTNAPLPERTATTDFFHDAAGAAARHGLRFFMLGGTEQQSAAVVQSLARLYPDLKVVGAHHGYFSEDEDAAVCAAICASGADVLWVGLGKPRQEFWSVRNRSRLAGVGWVKTCGGLYAFLTGETRRAPKLMQKLGLEWLWRVLLDPKRLAWRYLTTNPYAFYRLVRYTEWSAMRPRGLTGAGRHVSERERPVALRPDETGRQTGQLE